MNTKKREPRGEHEACDKSKTNREGKNKDTTLKDSGQGHHR